MSLELRSFHSATNGQLAITHAVLSGLQGLMHRPQKPDQIFAIHWLPRDSAAEKVWQFLDSIRRRDGRCPKAFLPFEHVMEYDERPLIVVSP